MKEMSYEEFLSALRTSPRDWRVDEQNCIRRGPVNSFGGLCPLMEIFIDPHDMYGQYFSDAVFRAADDFNRHNPQIRKDLLEACGLA